MTEETNNEIFEPAAPVYDSVAGDEFNAEYLNNVLNNAPQMPDDSLPRYAMSFLLPIALMNMTHADKYGDFNIKDPRTGFNKTNLNWYPAFELMPLYGVQVDVPFENFPTETEELPSAAPFDIGMYSRQRNKGFEKVYRNPRQCADLCLKKHRDHGLIVFDSLTGTIRQGQSAAEEEYKLIRKLLGIIFPIKDREAFRETYRVKNGVKFNSPFLDEMREFVQKQSLPRLLSAKGLKPLEIETGEKLHREIMKGVAKGLQLANKFLNEVETEMQSKDGMKKTYDSPNLEVPDAPLPTELYCLAHTNRMEIDDKQLQSSANIGESIADKFSVAMDKITTIANGLPAATANAPVMTDDEVKNLLAQQREEFEERERAMEERFSRMFEERFQTGAAGQKAESKEDGKAKNSK